MKKSFLFLSVIALSLIAASCGNSKKIVLFNGEDIDNWVIVSRPDSTISADQIFTVKNGVISVLGTPYGYMRTTEKYSNFTAHCEFRWADGKGSNSGFFVRVQNEDKVWPTMIECQFMVDHVGDLLGKVENTEVVGDIRAPRVVGDGCAEAENAIGEWNAVDVTCEGTHITIMVNGKVVNEAETTLTEGYIALQSEGGPIEFRNVFVIPE